MFNGLQDVFLLLIIMPALMASAALATVIFLLYKKTDRSELLAFCIFSISLSVYGLLDFITNFAMRKGVLDLETVAIACIFLASLCFLIFSFGNLFAKFLGVGFGRIHKLLLLLPVLYSIIIVLLLPVLNLDFTTFFMLAKILLFALFGIIVFYSIWAIFIKKVIKDKLIRKLLTLAVVVLLGFTPLWILESLGIIRVGSFYLYLFLWSGLSIYLSYKQFFAPPVDPPTIKAAIENKMRVRFGFTDREIEVANLHLEGLGSNEIGERLFISAKTVRNHITNLYAKAGVHSRFALSRLFE